MAEGFLYKLHLLSETLKTLTQQPILGWQNYDRFGVPVMESSACLATAPYGMPPAASEQESREDIDLTAGAEAAVLAQSIGTSRFTGWEQHLLLHV